MILNCIFHIQKILILSPRHISQPKCGRPKAEKRQQHETLYETYDCYKNGGVMENNNEKLYNMWNDFKNTLIYKNRFFNKHIILDYIETILSNNEIFIPKDQILYRARIYKGDLSFIDEFKRYITNHNTSDNEKDDDVYSSLFSKMKENDLLRRSDTGFWGYDEKDSYVPPNADFVKAGRANPEKISYLYLANEPMCAVAEVRPLIQEHISVAEVVMLEELRVADLSYDAIGRVDEDLKFLTYILIEEYSTPNNNDPLEYITTQFISEYIKYLKYDGFKFSSSLYGRGRNFVIFNSDKCKVISSKLYKLEDVCLDLKCVGPVGNLYGKDDLYHWKLENYKENCRNELKKKMPVPHLK